VAFFSIVSIALAHIPQFAEGGTTLQGATLVDQPSTSWVYYGTLDTPNEVRYYRLDLRAGDRLHAQLLTPREGPFPGLAVMGPGMPSQGQLPPFVEAPPGAPVTVEQGTADTAEYEPFTPGAYWYPATMDTQVSEDGSYYVAVYGPEQPVGPYGIAIGYEEKYTVPAWLKLPADLLSIYAWDGGWGLALLPGILVLVAGGAIVGWRAVAWRRRTGLGRSPSSWLALAAGIFCLTTSVTVLVQMIRAAGRSGPANEMAVTAFFIVGPAVLGGLLLWLGWRTAGAPGIGMRLGMLVLGLAGFTVLAGYFVGPVLAVAAAAAPPYGRARLGDAVPVGRVVAQDDPGDPAPAGAARATSVPPGDQAPATAHRRPRRP
jgi:hypothetical protein